jgi:protein-S-isoprenylcysteine O-methyltransferase Ste14
MTAYDVSDGGLRLALLMNAAATFLVLGLATQHFFRCPTADAPLRLRVHRLLGMAFCVLHVGTLAAGPAASRPAMATALGLYLGGLALFLWAQEAVKGRPPGLTFTATPPEALTTDGAYAYVRHPFYLAFLAVWWAGAIGTGSPYVLASTVWMTAAYAWAARDEERWFLQSPWAEAYRNYAERTGGWLPRPALSASGAAGPIIRRVHAMSGPILILAVLAAVIIATASALP